MVSLPISKLLNSGRDSLKNCKGYKVNITLLGGGFIGSNLAKHCVDAGFNVIVLDRGICPDSLATNKARWIHGNIENLQYLHKAIKGADVVFHLFSSTVPADKVSVENELSHNVFLLSNILDVCIEHKVKRFIFMSSSSVYGIQERECISELSVPLPISIHGLQKLAMENLIYIKSLHSAMDYRVLRLANPYGPGQSLVGRQGIIAILLGKVMRNEVLDIYGDGEAIRDYIFIDDLCRFCLSCLDDRSNQAIYNIGCGIGYSLKQIIKKVENICNCVVKKNYRAARAEDIPTSILDISKAQQLLNFSPDHDIDNGIKLFWNKLNVKGKN